MYHEIEIIGNLGSDPEMRYTPSGAAVTNFNVATAERIKKERNGEEVKCPEGWKESYNSKYWELTTWFRVTCWRGLAEIANDFLQKGSQVFVKGTLKGAAVDGTQNPRVWTGNDGEARASFEVTARTLKFIGSRESGSGQRQQEEEEPPGYYADENDIPF